MSPRLSNEELAAALGARLGGTVYGLRRLSGGASRVTSSFDLETAEGAIRPLILQMDRSGGSPGRAKARLEDGLLHAAADAEVPVPAVVAAPDFAGPDGDDALGAPGSWWSASKARPSRARSCATPTTTTPAPP